MIPPTSRPWSSMTTGPDQGSLRLQHRDRVQMRERRQVRLRQAFFTGGQVDPAAGPDIRGLREGVVPQREHHQLRGQRLRRVPRRALRLTPPALGAGREVQPTLPGEVLHLPDPEGVLLRVRLLQVQHRTVRHHRPQRTQRGPTRVLTFEVDVEERQEPVPRHPHRQVPGDHDRPDHRDDHLDQRDHRDRPHPRRQPDFPAKWRSAPPMSGTATTRSTTRTRGSGRCTPRSRGSPPRRNTPAQHSTR